MVNKLKLSRIDYGVIIFSFLFSTWLFCSTFGYKNGNMLIGSRLWSDFSSTIPMIRSFSFGNNFPPQYPLFAEAPMRFHFIFYVFVGLLEKIGVRIDYALNFFSILGFTGLLFCIYFFAKMLFQSKKIALLSLAFFLFNGTLSFTYFFEKHPLSWSTPYDIIHNTTFPSFGPYDTHLVSAFWNLNVYTNQRHFAAAMALSLTLIAYLTYKGLHHKTISVFTSIAIGIAFGLLFFLHTAIFVMTGILVFLLSLSFRSIRIPGFIILAVTGVLFLPQYLYSQSGDTTFKTLLRPGYLVAGSLTPVSFIVYWFYNLGLHSVLIPIGFIKAPKNAKKIFLCFFSLFIIGNLFQFSPEIAANHKFFNYFMILGNMFSAYALILLWQKRSILTKGIVVVSIFFLMLSGIIDFFPVANDYSISLPDYPVNQDILWVMHHTNPHAIMLNNTYLYDTASLAGRPIMMGWPYFSWSAGYDTTKRGNLMKTIFAAQTKESACSNLEQNRISYVEITQNSLKDPNAPPVSRLYFTAFNPIYKDLQTGYTLISVSQSCDSHT